MTQEQTFSSLERLLGIGHPFISTFGRDWPEAD
jgi:hypothetical protein